MDKGSGTASFTHRAPGHRLVLGGLVLLYVSVCVEGLWPVQLINYDFH